MNRVKISSCIPKHSASDFSFQKHCEPLVTPKMLICCVRHQISRPTVRNFVSNNRCKRFVAGLKQSKTKNDCVVCPRDLKQNVYDLCTNKVGVMKVKHGFSIPPYGKLGGITSKSYVFHTYGPQICSAISSICDVSENSSAHSSTMPSSAQTFDLFQRRKIC